MLKRKNPPVVKDALKRENNKDPCRAVKQGWDVIGGVLLLVMVFVFIFSFIFDVLPSDVFKTLLVSVESAIMIVYPEMQDIVMDTNQ